MTSRRIYLNTSDILNGDSDNHADCQYDLSKAGIDINLVVLKYQPQQD